MFLPARLRLANRFPSQRPSFSRIDCAHHLVAAQLIAPAYMDQKLSKVYHKPPQLQIIGRKKRDYWGIIARMSGDQANLALHTSLVVAHRNISSCVWQSFHLLTINNNRYPPMIHRMLSTETYLVSSGMSIAVSSGWSLYSD